MEAAGESSGAALAPESQRKGGPGTGSGWGPVSPDELLLQVSPGVPQSSGDGG